ncbi:patatin-like protein [Streptomyces sp. R35]|uniref:Patatin-like protein n=1 Tax=Streptomyces sp. R35 TaxID=3238630 RepID=A0AB39RV30_9ACTN
MGNTTRLGPTTQELRIATAMTGGVSLAIWMGGVARELNLLQQAAWWRNALQEDDPLPEPDDTAGGDERAKALYLRLLELLDTTVSIDVLSGTSAGGINAALLGLARARSWDLGPLRDFWLKSGAFETLLRDPAQKQPPSLLQGDGVLFRELLNGIEGLGLASQSGRPSPGTVADDVTNGTQVFITTTLLTGETGRFTDSYGTQVQDEDHRGLFVFDERVLGEKSGEQAVALAARSSASYPAAFEPSFLPYDTPVDGTRDVPERPVMRKYTNITRSHWAADGGLLANRPIRPLLRAIFDRPAERQVRRVLLYVVPSAGAAPDPRATPPQESFNEPWTLGEALMKDLGAALSQSISAELSELRDHNDRMDALRDTRRRMAELGARGRMAARALAECRERHGEDEVADAAVGRLVTLQMCEDFRIREGTWLARPVNTALMRALTTRPAKALAQAWLAAMAPGGGAEEVCRDAAVNAVTAQWNFPEPGDRGDVLYGRLADFGVAPFDGAKATVLAMLREAFVCCPEQRTELAKVVRRVHRAFVPDRRPDVEELVERAMNEGQARGSALGDVAGDAVRAYWDQRGRPAPPPQDGGGEDLSLKGAWSRLAAAVIRLRELVPQQSIEQAAVAPPVATTAQGRRRRAAAELGTYFGFLPDGRDGVALSLFELHVATRSVLSVGTEVEQPVELVQVSADTRCALAPRRPTAAKKLTGLQLHHFGAFYKSSWRANDWTWGRLDGAGWLVHLLLDPRRVLTVVPDAEAGKSRAEAFYERLCILFADGEDPDQPVDEAPDGTVTRLTKKAICGELRFLDHPDERLPSSLPLTSMWIAQSWQRCVAEVELPVIAREMLSTPATRTHPWATQVLDVAGSPERARAAAQTAVAAVMSGEWTAQQRELIEWEQRAAEQRKPGNAQQRSAGQRNPGESPQRTAQPQKPGASERQTYDPVTRADPAALAALLASCPVPDETFAGELGQPLLTRTISKAVAVATAGVCEVRRMPAPLKPFLASTRTITLAGYRASALTRGRSRTLILTGAAALTIGVLSMIQHVTWLGLTGTVLALLGSYLLVLGTWAHWRKALVAAGALTVVVAVFFTGCPVGRRVLFGTGGNDTGVAGRDVVPWLRTPWWHPIVALVGIALLALLFSGMFAAAWRGIRRRVDRRTGAPTTAGPTSQSGSESGAEVATGQTKEPTGHTEPHSGRGSPR